MSAHYLTHYRQEFVNAFSNSGGLFAGSYVDEAEINGNTAKFLVAGAPPEMVTRQGNGLIPAVNPSDTQPTITLVEKHYKETKKSFDIVNGQADQRMIMQNRAAKAVRREGDSVIRDTLTGATNQFNGGTALTAVSLANITEIISDLYDNEIDDDGNIYCAWSPKVWAQLQQIPAFTSSEYVRDGVLEGPQQEKRRWLNAVHFMDPRATGKGTSACKNYIWHRDSLGYANNLLPGEDGYAAGFNSEDAYSYVRGSVHHGASILQQAGILEVLFDES